MARKPRPLCRAYGSHHFATPPPTLPQIDRVIYVETVSPRGRSRQPAYKQYLVKWCQQGYNDCTWERQYELTSPEDLAAIEA